MVLMINIWPQLHCDEMVLQDLVKQTDMQRFPAFSAGWRIDQEGFMAGTEGVISNLSLELAGDKREIRK